MRYLLLGMMLFGHGLAAAPRQLDAYHWEDVGRIVAIGDLHGDYDGYLATLQSAGVVDRRGRWAAGETHLVQTGDIADRGPDTRRIIEHMARLARQAQKRGGRVHNLMGNHESMNVYGDLRYVTPGEFQAFVDRGSAALRDRYFDAVMAGLERDDPERHANLPEDYRAQWNEQHPLGWVEHRLAWDPRWDPEGELFEWVMQTKVAIQLNDLIFVHGGISHAYCGNSLASLTEMAHQALRSSEPGDLGILRDQLGPLWYRGLALVPETMRHDFIDAILARHGAQRIVVGHTPTGGVIWPRLEGRVILIDTGISAAYGGRIGWLEVTADGLYAGYRNGRLPLPLNDAQRLDYLKAVIALQPGNQALQQRLDALQAGQGPVARGEPEDAGAEGAGAPAPEPAVTCDTTK